MTLAVTLTILYVTEYIMPSSATALNMDCHDILLHTAPPVLNSILKIHKGFSSL